MMTIEEKREKRKEIARKYRLTDKWKEYYKKYSKSEKRKESAKKFYESDKSKLWYSNWREKNREKCNQASLNWYYKNSEKVKNKRKLDINYKTKAKKYKETQDLRHPEQAKVKIIFHNARLCGKIIKQPCSVCGFNKSEGHHYDYNKPLDVIWLCKKHHSELHRKLRRRIIK